MKLKFANSLLVAGLIVSAAGCFTSCKDTDEDYFDQLKYEILTLEEGTDTRITALENAVTALGNADQTLQKNIDALKEELEKKIDEIKECTCASELQSLKDQITTLQNTIADMQVADTAAQNQIDAIQEFLDSLPEDLSARLAAVESLASSLDATVTDLTTNVIPGIKDDLENLKHTVDGFQEEVNDILAEIEDVKDVLDGLQSQIDDINARLDDEQTGLDAIWTNITSLWNAHNALDERVKANEDLIGELNESVSSIEEVNKAQQEEIDTLMNRTDIMKIQIANLETALNDAQELLQKEIDDLEQWVKDNYVTLESFNKLSGRVSANETAIAELQKTTDELVKNVNDLLDRVTNLEKRVTTILIQQVSNPLFGSISLPIDVQSLVLFNYFGKSEKHTITFPYTSGSEYDRDYSTGNPLEGVTLRNVETITLEEDATFLGGDGVWGRIYFTANPLSLDLTQGYTASLINSQGEALPVTLSNIRKSTEVLTFLNSRADTYLWEADVTLDNPDDVGSIRLKTESGLREAAKELIENRDAQSIAQLGLAMYKGITNNTSMPRLGLKLGWDDESAVSEYSMYCGSVRPISFMFLADKSLDSRIPTLPNWDNFIDKIRDKANATFDEYKNELTFHFDFGTFNANLDEKDFNLTIPEFNLTLTFSDAITYQIPEYEIVDGPDGPEIQIVGYETKNVENVDELLDQISDQVKAALDEFVDKLQKRVTDMTDQMNDLYNDINKIMDDLNEFLGDMETEIDEQVNSKIQDVLEDLQSKVNNMIDRIDSRIGNYYDRFQSIYNRIANLIKEPNHYLQPFMLYHDKTNGNIARVSTSKAVPSQWSISGENGAVTLIPTTYNADLITPPYKKFVGVISAVDANGNESDAAVDYANSGTRMNEVINGDYETVAFYFQKGYTYTIAYQALDYHGYTSTVKYYVTIK